MAIIPKVEDKVEKSVMRLRVFFICLVKVNILLGNV